jgi:hypothetical protein
MPIEIKQSLTRTTNAGENPEITDGTPIVRYIKLSTLLLLLSGKVFVPTLQNLQRGEKFEGQVPAQVWKNYADNLFIDLDPFEECLLGRER